MKFHSWGRTVALVLAGVLVGGTLLATMPANAALKTSITTIWNKIKPKADKRYVKKTDRSKIVRTATVSFTGSGVTATTVSYGSATITAPSKGFLVLSSTGTYLVSTATPLLHCGLGLDGDTASWDDTFATSAATTVSATGYAQCDVSLRIPTTPGIHTVDYLAHNDGSGTASLAGGALTVTFVPYGSAGSQGAGRAPAPRGGDIVRSTMR